MPYEVLLSGNVQGVGCRWYCSHVGQRMGLRGAATNLDDGTVQVILSTEDSEAAHLYANTLKENKFNLSFWGSIKTVEVSKTNLPVDGDYLW